MKYVVHNSDDENQSISINLFRNNVTINDKNINQFTISSQKVNKKSIITQVRNW